MKVRIDSIIIGDRRREDMGDVQGLADSIAKYGLLHPVVMDDQNRLVAGGRRLAACKLLGWEEIEARHIGELTEKQLREIELEENLRRKDLTEIEKSRNMVKLVQVIREQIKEESACTPGVQATSNVKGVKMPGSYRDISERTGYPVQTIREAEQHNVATEKYPELEGLPKKEAICTAKKLDALPPEARLKMNDIVVAKTFAEPLEKEATEEFLRAKRIKEGMRRLIERLHIFSQNPPSTYFEGMDKVDLAFEEAFWWNNLKIIDGALEWLTEFRKEYGKRFSAQKDIRRVK